MPGSNTRFERAASLDSGLDREVVGDWQVNNSTRKTVRACYSGCIRFPASMADLSTSRSSSGMPYASHQLIFAPGHWLLAHIPLVLSCTSHARDVRLKCHAQFDTFSRGCLLQRTSVSPSYLHHSLRCYRDSVNGKREESQIYAFSFCRPTAPNHQTSC